METDLTSQSAWVLTVKLEYCNLRPLQILILRFYALQIGSH